MLAKQSTALTVVVGPILDSTGAEYSSAVIGDLSISKNGGTLTAMASAATLTYIANGMYTLVTTAGNMDTLGAVQITCNKATYQMPKMERNVVPASVYDAIITNATNATGGLPTATAAISAFAGAISTLTAGGVRTELATELSRIDQTIGSRATQTSVNAIPTTPLLSTDPRLANLDFPISTVNNNILNLNNLSAKMNLFGSPLLEIPEAGTTVYAFTVVVKDDEDKLVNLDASPTLAAANAAGTSRSGNLSAVSNPSTGRYTFTYSVASTHASESLRITVSGSVSSEARYIEWVGSVVNYDSLTVLQLVQSTVNAIDTRLPASPAAVGNIPTAATIRDTIMNSMPGGGWVNGSFGDRWVIGVNNNREVQVTGSNHISADIHAFQNGVLTAAAIAAGALNGKGDWLTSLGANAPAGWINAASITTDAITNDKIAASAVTKITVNLFKYGDIQRWNSPANQIDVTITKV